MAKKAPKTEAVDPRPALVRVLFLTSCIAPLFLLAISLFGLATKDAKLGAISLPLFCFTFLAAACVSAFEVIADYLAPSKKIARIAHAVICLILSYIAAGILFALSILRLDFSSFFGIIAVFFIALALYGVFFLILWGVGKLIGLLPKRLAPQKTVAHGVILFQGVAFVFLCFASIFAALRQASDIGLHLAQYSILFGFTLCYAIVGRLLSGKNAALRFFALWAVTLLGFTFGIVLTDFNVILPFTNLADRFVAYSVISLLFWAITLGGYGIRKAVNAKMQKKDPSSTPKKPYEKMF